MAAHPSEVRDRAVAMVLDERRPVTQVAQERGLSVSTLRHWVAQERDRRRGRAWLDQVAPAFEFLTSRGFALADAGGSDWWEVGAVYRAQRAAVQVVCNTEFPRAEVRLMRAALLDLPGRSSRERFFVTGVPGMLGHLADRLLEPAYPDARQRDELVRGYAGLEPGQVARALEFWAGVLRERAPQFLADDLSILDGWESGWGRVAVTVYVAQDATDRQEASAVARVRAALPDASIVTKRVIPMIT